MTVPLPLRSRHLEISLTSRCFASISVFVRGRKAMKQYTASVGVNCCLRIALQFPTPFLTVIHHLALRCATIIGNLKLSTAPK